MLQTKNTDWDNWDFHFPVRFLILLLLIFYMSETFGQSVCGRIHYGEIKILKTLFCLNTKEQQGRAETSM